MQHKISLARSVYSRAKTVIIDDIFTTLGKVTSTLIYENCIRGDLMRDRTIIVVATYPSMFWARDAHLFIHMAYNENENQGRIDSEETDPEKIVALIKLRRAQEQQLKKEKQQDDHGLGEHIASKESSLNQPNFASTSTAAAAAAAVGGAATAADVIDALFEHTGSASIHNNPSTLFEDDFFDEASIIPDSIRQEDDDNIVYKSRDFAYATYYAACGGWKYWTAAILFTLLARLANISESYWLKEGKTIFFFIYLQERRSTSFLFDSILSVLCKVTRFFLLSIGMVHGLFKVQYLFLQ
jgi:hypothetical protein